MRPNVRCTCRRAQHQVSWLDTTVHPASSRMARDEPRQVNSGVSRLPMDLLTLPDLRFPVAMRDRDDTCGPRVLWTAIRHFGRRTTAERLVRLSGWRAGEGVHTIALATTLASFGLAVEFHSDPDPAPQPPELPHYQRAREAGIRLGAPLPVAELLRQTSVRQLAILFFDVDGEGHFSILRGVHGAMVILNDAFYPVERFERMRATPETLRQTILVSDPRAAV